MSNRHYHIWLYERDADGRINTMRRDGATFDNRRRRRITAMDLAGLQQEARELGARLAANGEDA